MLRKLFIGLCLFLWLCSPAGANLATNGIPVDPHGFPLFYGDGALQLELCLDANGMCVFDPVDPANAFSVTAGFGAEAFWWLADAQVRPLVAGGKAILVMGLEAAYGGNGTIADGNQISFARIRVRVDVAQPGTYRITHPFGLLDFPNVTVAGGINFTEDIGAVNPLDPAAGFAGALSGRIGPFLTWPDFQTDPTLLDPVTGAQYIGNPGIAHTVTGGTNGNVFRIEREEPAGSGTFVLVDETDLFTVAGKLLSPTTPAVAHVFPPPVAPKLLAVGPVNRDEAFPLAGSNLAHPGGAAAVPEFTLNPPPPNVYPAGTGYPVGFPYWYEDTPDDIAAVIASGVTTFAEGLKLTICPGSDPMCISMPVDPANPQSTLLNVGDESFWWSADASVVGQGVDALLVMGLEGAFGGTGVVNEGDQIAFTRLRIRIDTPLAGDYIVTHPFGQIAFPGVPAGTRAINYTEDIGNINAAAPDAAFQGALFGNIPRFLTWTTFNTNPALNDPLLVIANAADPLAPFLYIGSPAIPHAVTGSPIVDATHASGFQNYFRVQGPGGIDVQTDLFTVQGKVYSDATFVPPPPIAGSPVAVADAVTVSGGAATAVNVLANDTFTAPVTVELLPAATFGPFNGQAVVTGNTVTYTPVAGFSGVDSFTYRIVAGALISNNATVSVTVDNMTVNRAELDLRRLQWNIRGSGAPGATLTLHEGPGLNGAVIGSVLVDAGGGWQFRGRALTATTVTSISVVSSTGSQLLNQPLRIR